MRANDDLKQLRRRVYMSYFQDGLWDISGIFPAGLGIYRLA